MTSARRIAMGLLLGSLMAGPVLAQETIPPLDELLAYKVALKPELVGVHPRVFVTKAGLEVLRERARTTHRAEWSKVTARVAATKGAPPRVPGPQERRSQNDVAFAIAEAALVYAVENKPEYLTAAKAWTLAAIDYEPWGYTYNKPTPIWPPVICCTRSAGPTTCCTTTSARPNARGFADRSNVTPALSTMRWRRYRDAHSTSPRITTSYRRRGSPSPPSP